MSQAAHLQTTRTCDGCTLCCKILGVDELQKPANAWCAHCERTKGCSIYAERPPSCQTFQCLFLAVAAFPEEWRPNRAHFVLVSEPDGRRVSVRCDSQRPDAWRSEPYYSYFKRWSAQRLAQDMLLLVISAGRTIVVLPDRDVDFGVLTDEHILTERRLTPTGIRYEVHSLPASDPRVVALNKTP